MEKGCFNKVFSKPVYTKKTPYVSIFAGARNKTQARLGIVVAKRNVKLAVARNRLKRIVRESFRQQQQALQGLDIVVVIKKNFIAEHPSPVNLTAIFKVVGDRFNQNVQTSVGHHVATTSDHLHTAV